MGNHLQRCPWDDHEVTGVAVPTLPSTSGSGQAMVSPSCPPWGQLVTSGGTFDFYNWLGRGWGWYCWHLVGEVSFVLSRFPFHGL